MLTFTDQQMQELVNLLGGVPFMHALPIANLIERIVKENKITEKEILKDNPPKNDPPQKG